MSFLEHSVQYKYDSNDTSSISIEIPDPSIGRWVFEDIAYHKESTDPVDLRIYLVLNDQVEFLIREKLGHTERDWYFQLGKECTSSWKIRFEASGLIAGVYHEAVLFYKA